MRRRIITFFEQAPPTNLAIYLTLAVLVPPCILMFVLLALLDNVEVWAGFGQWVGGIGALFAAVVALVVSQRERFVAKKDARLRSLAQAHLVVGPGGNPGFRPVTDWPGIPDAVVMMEFPFANWSDRPVRDVYAELWVDGEHMPRASHVPIVRRDEEFPLKLVFTKTYECIGGWRLRWTDADGQRWYRNRYPQEAPEHFTDEMLDWSPYRQSA